MPWDALADPVRRAIVERLAGGEMGAGELAAQFPISRPAVSRHLRVLREAGLVRSTVAAQERIYTLDRGPLAELEAWLRRIHASPDAEHRAAGPPDRGAPGPAGRLDALDTELHRGRKDRHRAPLAAHTDEGDTHGDHRTG